MPPKSPPGIPSPLLALPRLLSSLSLYRHLSALERRRTFRPAAAAAAAASSSSVLSRVRASAIDDGEDDDERATIDNSHMIKLHAWRDLATCRSPGRKKTEEKSPVKVTLAPLETERS